MSASVEIDAETRRRVLVTGAGGLVGRALCVALRRAGHDVTGTVRSRPAPVGVEATALELSEPGAFARLVDEVRPDLVVHTAYSMSALERDVVAATTAVATACGAGGVPLIHLSTDAVFDGERAPYAEEDRPEPVHPYGRAKLEAEQVVEVEAPGSAVVRTALIAHLDDDRPDSGTSWVLDAQRRGDPVTLFTDEIRSVVRLDDLVESLAELVALDPEARAGIWHVGGPERLSRWELGQVLVERYGLDASLIRAGLAASMDAPRPRDVSLTCARLLSELSIRPGPVATVPGHGEATR